MVGGKDLLHTRYSKRITAVYGSSGTQVRASVSQVILTATMRLLGMGIIPFVVWVATVSTNQGLDNPLTKEPHTAKDIVLVVASMFLIAYQGMKLAPIMQSMMVGSIAANTIVELAKHEVEADAPVEHLTLNHQLTIPLDNDETAVVKAGSIAMLKGSSSKIRQII